MARTLVFRVESIRNSEKSTLCLSYAKVAVATMGRIHNGQKLFILFETMKFSEKDALVCQLQ